MIFLKNLIGILVNKSLSSESGEINPIKKTGLTENEQQANLVQPIKDIETLPLKMTYEENDVDTALSSFCPEVVEVINEEEEKVA